MAVPGKHLGRCGRVSHDDEHFGAGPDAHKGPHLGLFDALELQGCHVMALPIARQDAWVHGAMGMQEALVHGEAWRLLICSLHGREQTCACERGGAYKCSTNGVWPACREL